MELICILRVNVLLSGHFFEFRIKKIVQLMVSQILLQVTISKRKLNW